MLSTVFGATVLLLNTNRLWWIRTSSRGREDTLNQALARLITFISLDVHLSKRSLARPKSTLASGRTIFRLKLQDSLPSWWLY